MGKAREQATMKFQGQPPLTPIGGLAKSTVQETYSKREHCRYKAALWATYGCGEMSREQ